MHSSSPSGDTADLAAAVAAHLANSNSRVSALQFHGKTLWVKQLETLPLRLRLQKGNPATAFQAERKALHFLVAQNAPVPRIVLEGPEFMVLSDSGTSLFHILNTPLHTANERLEIFAAAGKALAAWHKSGLAHGRPAIKDMCWQDGGIKFLDFERFDTTKCGPARQAQDVVIFVHSLFALNGQPSPEAEAAIEAYRTHDQLGLWPRAKGLSRRLRWLDFLTKPLQWRKSKSAREFKAIPLTLGAFKRR